MKEISDFSTSVMWWNVKLIHMWRNFRYSTSVMYRNLKFLHRTDFFSTEPSVCPWQKSGMVEAKHQKCWGKDFRDIFRPVCSFIFWPDINIGLVQTLYNCAVAITNHAVPLPLRPKLKAGRKWWWWTRNNVWRVLCPFMQNFLPILQNSNQHWEFLTSCLTFSLLFDWFTKYMGGLTAKTVS